jgi:hypothetical protein
MDTATKKPGEVLISYSWDSESHVQDVLALSDRLRSKGIDCVIDQYEVSPPEGWPRWMDRKIASCDLVIVICTKTYLARVMDEEEQGKGNGVKWEGTIIYQHLYNQGAENRKFIPVLMRDSDKAYIPIPLQGASYFSIETDAGQQRLYNRLLGLPPAAKPPLGERPAMPKKEVQTDIGSFLRTPIDIPLWNKAEWRGTAFLVMPESLPILGLAFTNRDAALRIFRDWRNRYGDAETHEELRIAIIEGEIPGEDAGYTVHVGLNFENVFERYKEAGLEPDKKTFFTSTTRLNRMNPKPGSPYLALFKEVYEEKGEFLLIPAILNSDGSMERIVELGIRKKSLIFRKSSDIPPGDIDSIVLHSGSQKRPLTAYGEALAKKRGNAK